MINFLLKDETARRVLGGGASRYVLVWVELCQARSSKETQLYL